ncbi:MAG: penicillin-binding protein 2 [Coriobacteriales bacterium]|nr:penicillin-binding protein 2 [Coriobacteriales bacterium]
MSTWVWGVLIALVVALISLAVFVKVFKKINNRDQLGLKKNAVEYDLTGATASKINHDMAYSIEEQSDTSIRTRLRWLGYGAAGLFSILGLRLWGIQLLSGEQYTSQAESNRTREVSLKPARGRILDRNGIPLVENRLSMAVVADKSVVNNTRLVRRLSNLLGIPEITVRHNIQSIREGAQSARTVMIDASDAAVGYILEHPSQFPGVSIEDRTVRMYPQGSLACHVLGYTGSISSEEMKAFAEDSNNLVTYQAGDIVGKSGIEYEYEGVLQGIRGTRTVYVDASGDVTGVVSEVPAIPGSDIRLTIDIGIQRAAEDAILTGMDVARYFKYQPTGGTCICMNCKTGEVLALASYPDYDPSSFVGGISTEAWAQLIRADANTPLLNRVIDGLYPSASTIKPLTTSAALESRLITTDSMFYCPGLWEGFGEEYGMYCWNHDGHQDIDLHSGIVVSCDCVFYEIAKAFYSSKNPQGIQDMYRRWGLGSVTNIDLPGEYRGRIPDAEWKWNWYTWARDYDRAWQPGDTANIAIGQGDVLVTPLQMCYVYCGLANNGIQMKPHLMLDVLSNETRQPVITNHRIVQNKVNISRDILNFVNRALWGVINESSSLSEYFEDLPVEVLGKSGTGEAGDDPDNTHAWFIAAAPADDPTYVVTSLVEHGGGGSQVASHMCRQVLGAIYGVEMTDPISKILLANQQAGRID